MSDDDTPVRRSERLAQKRSAEDKAFEAEYGKLTRGDVLAGMAVRSMERTRRPPLPWSVQVTEETDPLLEVESSTGERKLCQVPLYQLRVSANAPSDEKEAMLDWFYRVTVHRTGPKDGEELSTSGPQLSCSFHNWSPPISRIVARVWGIVRKTGKLKAYHEFVWNKS